MFVLKLIAAHGLGHVFTASRTRTGTGIAAALLAATALVGLVLSPVCLWAADAVLSWSPPTANADGTPLADLAGYKVYWGSVPRGNTQPGCALSDVGCYSNKADAGSATMYTLRGLPEGTWYFAVTAYDAAGNESVYSNEVSSAVAIPPMAPALKGSIIIIIAP